MFLERILKKILGDSFEKTSFLYTPYSFIVILYSLEMPEQAVSSRNSIGFTLKFEIWEAGMNWILFFAAASFFVSVINTIYVVLSFYKKNKE